MKKFLRLSDEKWPFTEADLDPLMKSPNKYFKPNETEYVEPYAVEHPSFDGVLQEVIEVHPIKIDGVWAQQWQVIAKFSDTNIRGTTTTKEFYEAEALARVSAAAAEAAQAASKVEGIEILGVMCSATKEDQMGLTAVGLDYSMTTAAGDIFADTKFSFQNGSTLVITNENFSSIYSLWVPFRRSFFAPK